MNRTGDVIDATAQFEYARLGHVPTFELRHSAFTVALVCECSRCHRFVWFKSPEMPGGTKQ